METTEISESGFAKAVRLAGGAAELARACGVTPQAVGKWKRRVPAERVLQIVAAAGDGVAPSELRPDIYPI